MPPPDPDTADAEGPYAAGHRCAQHSGPPVRRGDAAPGGRGATTVRVPPGRGAVVVSSVRLAVDAPAGVCFDPLMETAGQAHTVLLDPFWVSRRADQFDQICR